MFQYPCPFCFQRLSAPPERAGQRTICPKCMKPFTIPSAALSDTPPGPADSQDSMPTPYTRDVVNPVDDPPPPSSPPEDETPLPGSPRPRVAQAFAATAPPPAVGYPYHAPTHVVALAPAATAENIAAQLSTALTLRMKPPPEPPSDLRLSTGLWLASVAVAVTLWLVAVLYSEEASPWVAWVGVLQIAFGYAWTVHLAWRRKPVYGLVTLLPPFAVVRLFRRSSRAGYRPLRSVVTGLALLGLYFCVPYVRQATGDLAGGGPPAKPPKAEPKPPETPAARLTAAARQLPVTKPVLDELARMAGTDRKAVRAAPPEQRAELAAELRALLQPDSKGQPRPAEVRAAALNALARLDDGGAVADVVAATRDTDRGFRHLVLEHLIDRVAESRSDPTLAAGLRDPALLAAVADRVADGDDRPLAQDLLLKVGGPAAEAAALPLLQSRDSQVRLVAREVVERCGGPAAAAELRRLIAATPDVSERLALERTLKAVEGRR